MLAVIMLASALFMAWSSNGFHAEKDLSHYPKIQLTYTNCQYQVIRERRGHQTRQLVLTAPTGRYVMDQAVWGKHFNGNDLARLLSGERTAQVWVHPNHPLLLRGLQAGSVDIPPQWGLEHDQRSARSSFWAATLFLLGGCLLFLRRSNS